MRRSTARSSLVSLSFLLLLSVFTSRPVWAQATLENPSPGSFQSGVGVISGWVCEAERIDIVFNPGTATAETWRAGYRTTRPDTAYTPEGEVICGDTDNGFGLLFNWNRLGDGPHTVSALADGEEFGRATFTVTTLGKEFLEDARSEVVVEGVSNRKDADHPRLARVAPELRDSGGHEEERGDERDTPAYSGEPVTGVVSERGRGDFRLGVRPSGSTLSLILVPPRQRPGGPGYRTTRPRHRVYAGGGGPLRGHRQRLWAVIQLESARRRPTYGQCIGRRSGVRQSYRHGDHLGTGFSTGCQRGGGRARFPQSGSDTVLRWQESQQNFVIAESSQLRIAAPDPLPGFFAGVADSLQPVVRYTGKSPLSFALTTAPTGMAIDARTGTITWTPGEADAGRTSDVTVEVGDGYLFDSTAFQVSVLTPTPVQTTLSNGVLTVTDTNTTLSGLSIVTTDTGTRVQSTRQRPLGAAARAFSDRNVYTAAASTISLAGLRIEDG